MSKLNMKKAAIAIACLLLLVPATVAQSPAVQASAVCVDGELKGVVIHVQQSGTFKLQFPEGICDAPSREEGVTT